jgi:hypothetical protein
MANQDPNRCVVLRFPVPSDHFSRITYLPYFKNVRRPEAEEILRDTTNTYIIRFCGDPSEFINGLPNPNVFVISYTIGNIPGEFPIKHTKVYRFPESGLTFSNKLDSTIVLFDTVTELIKNSRINMIKPLGME